MSLKVSELLQRAADGLEAEIKRIQKELRKRTGYEVTLYGSNATKGVIYFDNEADMLAILSIVLLSRQLPEMQWTYSEGTQVKTHEMQDIYEVVIKFRDLEGAE